MFISYFCVHVIISITAFVKVISPKIINGNEKKSGITDHNFSEFSYARIYRPAPIITEIMDAINISSIQSPLSFSFQNVFPSDLRS